MLGYSTATTTSRERQNGASHADGVEAEMAKEAAIFISNDGLEQILRRLNQLGFGLGREGDEVAPAVRKVGSWLETTMGHDHDSGFCHPRCAARCEMVGRQDGCIQYCGICCEKCHCVPSGTCGNKDDCPCYRDMKNSKGEPKCP
ncbi:hypothetical protein BUALT_Bualt08G0122400 [Buddleja alternifolia]|uniref:Uncharacterized protein n=1 Tax=Buddleja alternifolia TaxID=168488 RepID=A0AAV6XGP8_9LAMI|nr:hypothetical protein BUALT_Bualt08G0122400 [Buddleja alternifolia]